MLSVKNLNKYYFKHKSNEIHVLNNINLEFNDKGLYFLLGPSGSGKSTLLNTIGLLDNFDTGSICIEDKTISKYKNVDDIRNIYFGYVFQNYLLNEEISVYDNLAIVLKLINYKGDYYKRIEEVLAALGMEKYIKRKAKDLSGGQKQRIGIARCLIKSPKIILMDEPTGNLDEKNSIQVMEIAKKLAKDCLIICVTHDENLAEAYGDYIIKLKDGQIISSEENFNKHDLNINDNNHIYLKDFKEEKVNNVNIYSNSDIKELNIVIDHNKIYIKGSGDIEVITEKSPIKLINEHRKEVKKEDINLNIEHIENKESKHVLPFMKLFKNAFKVKIKRLTKVAFIITSLIFASSLPFVSSLTDLDPNEFVETNSNTYENNSLVDVKDIVPLLNEDELIIGSNVKFNLVKLVNNDFISPKVAYLNGSYVPKTNNLKITMGTKSNDPLDIYIDEMIAKRLAKRPDMKSFGIFDYKDFLNKEVLFNYSNFKGKIVGLVNNNEPSIYVDSSLLMNTDGIYSSDLSFITTDPIKELKDDECMINSRLIFSEGTLTSYNGYKVVGQFSSPYEVTILVNNDAFLKKYYASLHDYAIYTKDINKFEEAFDVNFTNYRQDEIDEFKFARKTTIITNIVFIVTTLSISLVFLYFIMQSSLMHRIKEVGINRSIGVKKFDIYKIFSSEILAIVIKYSLPGYVIMTLVNFYLYDGGLLPGFNWNFVPLGIVAYVVLSLVIGLIPVFLLLRKTPSEINKKYDI